MCNHTFVSDKYYVKSRIANHLNKCHNNPITASEVNLKEIHEENIIISRIPQEVYNMLLEQMILPEFWASWREVLKIARAISK